MTAASNKDKQNLPVLTHRKSLIFLAAPEPTTEGPKTGSSASSHESLKRRTPPTNVAGPPPRLAAPRVAMISRCGDWRDEEKKMTKACVKFGEREKQGENENERERARRKRLNVFSCSLSIKDDEEEK